MATIALAQVLLGAKARGIIRGFAIKGGHAIELRLRRKARASRDVDVIIDASGEASIVDAIRTTLTEGWSGFTFTFREIEETAHALRFPMSAKYENGDWSTFDVEVVADDVTDEELVEPLDLAEFGLERPELVPCLDLYAQIAQKFHGATDPDESRPRDILDIYILRQTYNFDIERLRVSVEDLFTQRGKQLWPAPIELRDGWEAEIAGLIHKNDFVCTVAEVLGTVHAFALELMGVAMKVNYEYRFLVLNASARVPTVVENAVDNDMALEVFTRMTQTEGWRLAYLIRYPSLEVSRSMLAVLERPIESAE
ncbi:MAG: nucleotidyl transferase AbiEii/AbiGii toxin family protein [Vulcanimicrobiaceae bacterium]